MVSHSHTHILVPYGARPASGLSSGVGFEPPSLRLLSANAGKSDRSNPVTFSLPSGRTHAQK